MSSESPSEKRWVPPPRPMEGESKFWRKAKQNPLVPIGITIIFSRILYIYIYIYIYIYFFYFPSGCIGTVCVLGFGLLSFKRGNVVMSQKMMRLRVLFQGGTVLALVAGIALEAKNH